MATRTVTLLAMVFVAIVGVASLGAWLRVSAKRGESESRLNIALVADATQHDFGVVRADAGVLKHAFTLTNSSLRSVAIKPKRLGCGCMTIDCPDSIGPRSSASLSVEIEIANREGEFATGVSLTTSDPSVSLLEFTLKAFIEPMIQVTPPYLRFNDIAAEGLVERQVQVTEIVGGTVNRQVAPEVKASCDAIDCRYLKTTRIKARVGRLERAVHYFSIRIDPTRLLGVRGRRTSETVRIAFTENAPERVAQIPVEILIAPHRGLAGPASIAVKRRLGSPSRARIWARDGGEFQVTNIVTSSPELVADSLKGEASKLHEIRVRLRSSNSEGLQTAFVEVFGSRWPEDPYRIDVVVLP